MPFKMFCFGMGFVSQRLSIELIKQGWIIEGTTRSFEKAKNLFSQSIIPHVFNTYNNFPVYNLKDILKGVTHVLISVPPNSKSMKDPVLSYHSTDLSFLPPNTWIGYLSSTSVYGNHNGAIVTEQDILKPSSEIGRKRVLSEKEWLFFSQHHKLNLQIFRLSGIYGPGRNILKKIQLGSARHIIKENQIFSRIHVEDAVAMIIASIYTSKTHSSIYNVCDNLPAPPQNVLLYGCQLLNMIPPPIEYFQKNYINSKNARFYEDSKSVSNAFIKHELSYTMQYPDYRIGLKAIFDQKIIY